MIMIPETAGDMLKLKRKDLKLKQHEVAERAGISIRQYQKFESGEQDIMSSSFRIAGRVVEALELDIAEFFKNYSGAVASEKK